MDSKDLNQIIAKIEKESSLFSNKAYLDVLLIPSKIIGRQKQAEELVRFLLGYKQGFVVPFISVYGRSGSGKSTIVRFICENLEEISYCFVNLRKAKTIFGSANLILAELGQPSLKNAQGINLAMEQIGITIESILQDRKRKLFVLVLDESDVLFYDIRGNPSDFFYKLIVLEENLRKKGYLLCIISITNNIFSDYEIDERVRSRIGSSQILFDGYSTVDVEKILQERSKEAFSKQVNGEVIKYCAQLSSAEHGDARRAIDLLRVAAEIANSKGEDISKSHVNLASEKLQEDRITGFLSSASYQFKLVCLSLARITFLTEKEWHSTSAIYNQYKMIKPDTSALLSYRRISEFLTELENSGLAISETSSKGRRGYGKQYKLVVLPETVGNICFPKFWESIEEKKSEHEKGYQFPLESTSKNFKDLEKTLRQSVEQSWDDYVGAK